MVAGGRPNWPGWVAMNEPRAIRRFFEGKRPRAFVAWDMASRRDLCAAAIAYPRRNHDEPEKSTVWIENYAWTCRAAVDDREPAERILWNAWADAGWLTIHPGPVIRLRSVLHDFLEIAESLEIVAVGYDPWNAEFFVQELEDRGYECREFRQGYRTMSPAIKMVESALHEGRILHDGSPLLYAAIRAMKLDQDPAGNLKPNKAKSTGKIDPAVSFVMGGSMALLDLGEKPQSLGIGLI